MTQPPANDKETPPPLRLTAKKELFTKSTSKTSRIAHHTLHISDRLATMPLLTPSHQSRSNSIDSFTPTSAKAQQAISSPQDRDGPTALTLASSVPLQGKSPLMHFQDIVLPAMQTLYWTFEQRHPKSSKQSSQIHFSTPHIRISLMAMTKQRTSLRIHKPTSILARPTLRILLLHSRRF